MVGHRREDFVWEGCAAFVRGLQKGLSVECSGVKFVVTCCRVAWRSSCTARCLAGQSDSHGEIFVAAATSLKYRFNLEKMS